MSGAPSWKVTPERSLIRQVVGSTFCQDSASAGVTCRFGSGAIRRSKICAATFWLLPVREKCGSRAEGSVELPITRSAARAGAAPRRPATDADKARFLKGANGFMFVLLQGDDAGAYVAAAMSGRRLAAGWSFRWQALMWPAAISRSCGASRRQRAKAWGQRGWKWHPLGGASGEGISPLIGEKARRSIGDRRHLVEERDRIGMVRRGEEGIRRSALDDAAEIHDRDPVADVLHHADVVADEEVGEPEIAPQVHE